MKPLVLAGHDALDHVLPHRFGDKLFHWDVTFQAPFNLFKIEPHDTYFTNHLLMTLVAAAIMLAIFPLLGRRYAAMTARGPDQSVPRGFTNAIEFALQFIRNDVVRPILGDKTDRFMPFLWTMFFYILICNLLGMIPLDSIVKLVSGGKLEHVGGAATGNIMITAGLAFCAFIMIHISGAKQVYLELVAGTYGHHHHDEGEEHHEHDIQRARHPAGTSPATAVMQAPFSYVWNFAPHVFAKEGPRAAPSFVLRIIMIPLYVVFLSYVVRYGAMLFGDEASRIGAWLGGAGGFVAGTHAAGLHISDLLDAIMWFILLLLEAIGAIIKPFALSIRLFANMVAGHVVLASILALIFVFSGSVAMNWGVGVIAAVGSAALSLLELFVACLQAYIFTFLTALFIGASVSPEH